MLDTRTLAMLTAAMIAGMDEGPHRTTPPKNRAHYAKRKAARRTARRAARKARRINRSR